jgi:predicted secreted hydrolase
MKYTDAVAGSRKQTRWRSAIWLLGLAWIIAAGCNSGQVGNADMTQDDSALSNWQNHYPYWDGWLLFPLSEGKHEPGLWPFTLMEWYAHYGHLTAEDGSKYTYFVTLVGYDPLEPLAGSFFPHTIFNLVDETNQRYYNYISYEKLSEFSSLNVSMATLDGKSFRWKGLDKPFEYRLIVDGAGGPEGDATHFNLDIDLTMLKRPLVVNGNGFIRQPVGMSGYYSQTRLAINGTLTIGDQSKKVTGIQWIDRQWLGASFALNAIGFHRYEWWCIHLDNNEEAILYKIWGANGQVDARLFEINHAADGGKRQHVEDFTLDNLGYWQSPEFPYHTYSSGWRLSSDESGWDLTITPVFNEQEAHNPISFWSGSCTVNGTVDGEPVTGAAFAELLYSYTDTYVETGTLWRDLPPWIGEIIKKLFPDGVAQ